MNNKITVEDVLNFLVNKQNSGILLEKYADNKLKLLELPTTQEELEDDDVLEDALDMGICFLCDTGSDEKENVYVVGYKPKDKVVLVRGEFGIFPVGLAELEYISLLDLCKVLFY